MANKVEFCLNRSISTSQLSNFHQITTFYLLPHSKRTKYHSTQKKIYGSQNCWSSRNLLRYHLGVPGAGKLQRISTTPSQAAEDGSSGSVPLSTFPQPHCRWKQAEGGSVSNICARHMWAAVATSWCSGKWLPLSPSSYSLLTSQLLFHTTEETDIHTDTRNSISFTMHGMQRAKLRSWNPALKWMALATAICTQEPGQQLLTMPVVRQVIYSYTLNHTLSGDPCWTPYPSTRFL